jgi:NSS family neurotransmitter:Na+ symporter
MDRERWDKRSAFIMAAIGSAIGLGNVWRFPYVAYANGGGAFLIPYIIALITTGIPLVALEYYLGIRYQRGPTEAYGFMRKKSNYIGWFALCVAAMITFYYTVVMAWTWSYMLYSVGVQWAGVEKEFFFRKVLGLSGNILELGGLQWPLVLGNFLTWLAIFLILFKGVKVIGKVVNWTVGLPWLLLAILAIRGMTLNGSASGLDFYLRPDFSKLLDPNVWLAAYGQIFFSLSLGFGIMIAYASYLPRDSDINTNAWVVSFSDSATSFFAGFAVFSTLGYLAMASNQPLDKVVGAGPALAFIIYPTAIANLPGGVFVQSIFGIMFFSMLLALGIDSAFSLIEAVVTGLRDSFKIKRERALFWVCLVGFSLGFLYTSRAGLFWLDIVDHWMNWGLVIVGVLEAILVGWLYEINRVSADIDSTSEIKLGKFWIFCVKILTPLVLSVTIVLSICKEILNPYGEYPTWALMVGGWILLLTLLFLSILLQEREYLPTMTNRSLIVGGWLIIYVGMILSFYLFYYATMRLWASLLLPASIVAGTLIINGIRRQGLQDG